MLFLLHLQDGSILEGPLDDVGLLAGTLDELALGDGSPEVGEVLELDVCKRNVLVFVLTNWKRSRR